jgi:DNA-binding transcriptional regulator YhcF (GntR family)
MRKILQIDSSSNSPKYQQVIHAVIEAIEKKDLLQGDQLPSINELASELDIAKVTIAKAYEELKEKGIILSQHGKGFFVANTSVRVHLNIFILFDTINPYKEILYQSLRGALPKDSQCSIFFHHHNFQQFESLIRGSIGKYNYYVIMPHFDEDVSQVLKLIPEDKLLLLDKNAPKFQAACAAVYQDFRKDIESALASGEKLIRKYRKLKLILGKEHFQYVPSGIVRGATSFCTKHGISLEIVSNLVEKDIVSGEAYLIFSDGDLFRFIKHINKMKWKAGVDIGLISYDETPMKELLLNGVTVISTDFTLMGKTAGEMISARRSEKIANPGTLIKRSTL